VGRLFNGGEAGLKPGEEEAAELGEDGGEEAEEGAYSEADEFEPELHAELAGSGVGEVAERGVAEHLGVDEEDNYPNDDKEGDYSMRKHGPRVEGVAGDDQGDGEEEPGYSHRERADTAEHVLDDSEIDEADGLFGVSYVGGEVRDDLLHVSGFGVGDICWCGWDGDE